MTHQGNCLHIAIQWFSLLRPGSVRWTKKWLDVPALALWCFGPKMTLVPLPSVHWLELVTWTYLINSVALLIKGTVKYGKANEIPDKCYSFSHLWPTRPHLPACLSSHAPFLFLTHVSATVHFWVLLMHTQLLSTWGSVQFSFLSAMLSIIVSPGCYFWSSSSQSSVTIPAKTPASPHHNLLSSCLLVIFRALFPLSSPFRIPIMCFVEHFSVFYRALLFFSHFFFLKLCCAFIFFLVGFLSLPCTFHNRSLLSVLQIQPLSCQSLRVVVGSEWSNKRTTERLIVHCKLRLKNVTWRVGHHPPASWGPAQVGL